MKHECGLEVTHCDECQTELEVGQVGKCEDCREYTFEELSDEAKEKARQDYISSDYPYDDWWDGVYEDAARVAKILGLDITETRVEAGKTREVITNICINFSGFWSQGDGASFAGRYSFNEKAVEEMRSYCSDETLISLAERLTVMQVTQRLKSCELLSATITQYGNYNSMRHEIHDWGIDEVGEPDEDDFVNIMDGFATWIYNTLEAEYDHLCSDECVDQYLTEEKFDSTGAMI